MKIKLADSVQCYTGSVGTHLAQLALGVGLGLIRDIRVLEGGLVAASNVIRVLRSVVASRFRRVALLLETAVEDLLRVLLGLLAGVGVVDLRASDDRRQRRRTLALWPPAT